MPTQLLCALLAMLAATSACHAQVWPQRAVRLIVSLGPGSGADIGARLLADRLAKRWSQPVVVENRPGGDSVVAITSVLNANDDHILLSSPSSSFIAHPYTHARMPYDAAQLMPVVRVSNTIISASVPAASGIASMAGLVDAARKEPGKLNFAAATGLTDFQYQVFLRATGISMVRVPYRDTVQALNDLGESRIHFYTSAFAITRPLVESGKVRVIALINSQRAELLKGIPTVREAGYAMLEFDGLVGLFSAPIVPPAVRERIAADVIEAMKDPMVIDRLTATGQIINPGGPAEFAASIAQQRAGAAETAKALGLKRAE